MCGRVGLRVRGLPRQAPRRPEQPFLPEKSHVISLGQFSICPENVGIATTRFQSLKDCSGNYVRHLWGTMRVCGDLAGRGQPFLPENSHVIYLGQFSICPENVGIATTRFQSLKDCLGNYVRHLWGTMRVTVGVGGCAGVWCVEAGAGPAGPGRASRSITPSRRLACGDLAGGQAPRRRENGSRRLIKQAPRP